MRLLILQTAPQLASLDTNISSATSLLSSSLHNRPSPDLIILPELSFTGYNFLNPDHIAPFVETREKSPSRDWARRVAREYNCHVLVGLPSRPWDGQAQDKNKGEE